MSALVVGGGVAGLVAARELAVRGESVTVLEAGDRCGGAVRGEELYGVIADVGAEAYATTRPDAAALITELGLADRIVAPARADARIWYDGATHRLPPTVLGVPTTLDDPALVALVGPTAVTEAREQDSAPLVTYDADVTLGALVRDRLGDAIVQAVVDPLVTGVHSVRADDVEARTVLPGLLAALGEYGSLVAAAGSLRQGSRGPLVRDLDGGMSRLVDALVADVRARGGSVLTGAEVVRVERSWVDGVVPWTVHADRAHSADRLVLAVPAPSAAYLLADLPVPADAPRLVSLLEQIRVVPTVIVSLVVRSAALDAAPLGSGVLVAPGATDVRAKALTHATAKWAWLARAYGPGTHLLRLSYDPTRVACDGLVERAARDAATLTGAPLDLFDSRVTSWPETMVAPAPGVADRAELLRRALAPYHGLTVVGAGLGGNGLAGTIAYARSAVT